MIGYFNYLKNIKVSRGDGKERKEAKIISRGGATIVLVFQHMFSRSDATTFFVF
jgi:hypothetical protein